MPYTNYILLLAEDDVDDQLLFRQALEDLGVRQQPVMVFNGQQLVDYLKRAMVLPDLIFLDINMPLKDGLTALGEIKAIPSLAHLPVVILSTTSDEDTVSRAYELGACLYACKPTGYDLLVDLIRMILSPDNRDLLQNRQRDRFLIGACSPSLYRK
jgi:CheY-like chemotaxis protein